MVVVLGLDDVFGNQTLSIERQCFCASEGHYIVIGMAICLSVRLSVSLETLSLMRYSFDGKFHSSNFCFKVLS